MIRRSMFKEYSLKKPLMFTALFALLLAAPVEAGSPSMKRILLQCDDSITAQSACQAVKDALSKSPGSPQIILAGQNTGNSHVDLTVTLELTRQDADVLAGRLIWVTPDKQSTTGPDVEVSSFDAPLQTDAVNDLARGLLQVSDLPI